MKKKILREYENAIYDIYNNLSDMNFYKRSYKEIKHYIDKEISFEELYSVVDGSCPLNSCYWCNDNCNECDVKGNCKECWRKAIIEE